MFNHESEFRDSNYLFMKIFNLFPLTILEDAIEITDEDRDTLVQSIIKMKSDNEDNKKSEILLKKWFCNQLGNQFSPDK